MAQPTVKGMRARVWSHRLAALALALPLQFAVAREVFKNLERVMDAFEDAANRIDDIVIDHA